MNTELELGSAIDQLYDLEAINECFWGCFLTCKTEMIIVLSQILCEDQIQKIYFVLWQG